MDDMKVELANVILDSLWMRGLLSDIELQKSKDLCKNEISLKNIKDTSGRKINDAV